MSSILSRTAVLSLSRILNQLILIITPLLLVRLMDVQQYGQYREFILYAMLTVRIVGFGINRSLTYFVPKYPERERVFLSQAMLFVGLLTLAALVVLLSTRELLVDIFSFDFVTPLALFCLFYANFDFVELYYIAKQRPDIVLYYGVARLLLRVSVVVSTAYITEDVTTVVFAVVWAEAIRFLIVLTVTLRRRLVAFTGIDRDSVLEQIRYVLPIGISGILMQFGDRATSIFVAISMGPASLALYAVGTYPRSIISVLRGALADVIFPHMVERATLREGRQVSIWQRSTMAYCLVLFPIVGILILNADVIVEFLFTSKFSAAVPLFQLFALFLILRCFDFDLPLRAIGITKFFLNISWMGLLLKLALLFILYQIFGFLGPVLASLIAELIKILYLANRCIETLDISLSQILPWDQLAKILFACILGLPILLLPRYMEFTGIVTTFVTSSAYLLFYIGITRMIGVREVLELSDRIVTYIKAR